MKKELLAKYKNGNYYVKLYNDGTKVKYNNLDNFIPEFAESMDITITTKCDGHCSYCYLNCTENGKHADLTNPIFNNAHPGTELAINANDLSHPRLEEFLVKMKNKSVIVNITINQKHLLKNVEKLKYWQSKKLIWGIGVSLIDSSDPVFIKTLACLNNTVIHVIDGCFTKKDIENLSGHNLKILILGFKHKGRGLDYYNMHKKDVESNIAFLRNHLYDYRNKFNGFGFDNLATEDLNIRELVGEDKWSTNHMGNEGEFTYFIDLVNMQYAISSTETEYIFPITKDDTLDTMFKHIRKLSNY